MAARHRALARLHRHVPDVAAPDARALSRRLGDRAVEDVHETRMAGESIKVRDEVHERRLRGPDAGPNAPLLIRLVRHPYAMHPVPTRRRPDTARPEVRALRPVRDEETVRQILDGERLVFAGSPMQRLLAEAPPRPFTAVRREDDEPETVPVGLP